MSRFTKAIRQKIVREFALKNGGHYDPAAFVAEVRATGPKHEAYGWFEWDATKAAQAYQIEQARNFARDLRVSFAVTVINGGKRSVKVRETALPLVLSPLDGRKNGGGYVLYDDTDPSHMVEHCRQGAVALRAWWNRYESAATHVGCDGSLFNAFVALLEGAARKEDAA